MRIAGLKGEVSVAAACGLLVKSFRASQIESPEVDARVLIGHALDVSRASLAADPGRILDTREVKVISALAMRRLRHEPVARIIGEKEFWSLPFKIGDAVLVPRPETETVVEAAIEAANIHRQKPLRILDIGTGSGALLLALLSEFPAAHGTGVDISTEALDCARENARRLNLAARCSFLADDGAAKVSGPFELIVSNPPYIASGDIASLAPEVRDYDPMLALDGGADGLDGYRMVAGAARHLLAPEGRLVLELGATQEAQVCALLARSELKIVKTRKDLGGIVRALTAAL